MAELTHDEQDELAKAAYEADSSCAHNMVPLIRVVEEIVAAREAAARREALLEARWSVTVIRTPLNNLVGLSRGQAFHVGVGEVATLLDNMLLAEPERDEEPEHRYWGDRP